MKKFINPKGMGKEPVMYSHGVLVSFPKTLLQLVRWQWMIKGM